MKRVVMMMAVVAAFMCGCEKPVITEENGEPSEIGGDKNVKNFTFTLKGDFGSEWKPVTRGYLAADGKEMTDVWVLDYVDGQLVQQLHQTSADEDWGAPKMSLAYGLHHVYFVASRGVNPTVNVVERVITWEKASDTFWKNYEVNVVSTSNGNRAVTLERVATKLKLTVTDEVPVECASVAVTTGKRFDGLNYTTGSAIESQMKERVIAVPATYAGTTGQLTVTLYSLSDAEEWQTDVSIEARRSDGGVLGNATMNDVPFKRNRQTEYSGPLFGANGAMALTLDDEWEDAVTGVW